jgi:hypothetical protein
VSSAEARARDSASGSGRLLRYDARGRLLGTTVGLGGTLFGTGLSAPGDLNGDGWTDLVVSFAVDSAGADLRSLTIFDLAP